jgi:hypothetical protein
MVCLNELAKDERDFKRKNERNKSDKNMPIATKVGYLSMLK